MCYLKNAIEDIFKCYLIQHRIIKIPDSCIVSTYLMSFLFLCSSPAPLIPRLQGASKIYLVKNKGNQLTMTISIVKSPNLICHFCLKKHCCMYKRIKYFEKNVVNGDIFFMNNAGKI